MVWRHLSSEIVNTQRTKFEGGFGSPFEAAEFPMLIPCPARSADVCGVSGGMHPLIVVGTGSGPEGSRPTVNAWRPQGCGAESGSVEETGYVSSTDNTSLLILRVLWQK